MNPDQLVSAAAARKVTVASQLNDPMMLSRHVERVLRGSNAVDTEALCVVGGLKVWHIKVYIHILNDDGNLLDCCCLAALCSLKHFRKADVGISSSGFVSDQSHSTPVSLSIHHTPISVSFALYDAKSFYAAKLNRARTRAEEEKEAAITAAAVGDYNAKISNDESELVFSFSECFILRWCPCFFFSVITSYFLSFGFILG
jgi:exosome complex RNA-binding protein Rrp42 (RNase PH superfamily)